MIVAGGFGIPIMLPDDVQPDDFDLAASIVITPGTEAVAASWALGEVLSDLPDSRADWTTIGFDVCEEVAYSGLMNCGYEPEVRARLAPIWAPRLNEHHLFDTLEDADAFRKITDIRVPEHAPFLVHRLYVRP